MTALLLLLALTAPAKAGFQAGLIEEHTYKLGESAIPGTSTYRLRGVIREGRRVLLVEVETHRTMTLGGQQGKLESRSETWMDPTTWDLIESKLTTTMNGVEASFLHAIRKDKVIEVHQQLRGSPLDNRKVDAPGVAIDENVLNFYLERQNWIAGKTIEWQRYNAAQSRLLPNTAKLEKKEKDKIRVTVTTDIGPNLYDLRAGDRVVLRMEAAGAEQFALADPVKQ